MSKQTTLDGWLNISPKKNRYHDSSDDEPVVPSPPRRSRLPPTPESLNDPIRFNADMTDDDNDYGTINPKRKQGSSGRRANRQWDSIADRFDPKGYNFTAIPQKQALTDRQLSVFKQYLADMIINGNLRIKFSPKCATRKGAEMYCQTKMDEDGYPKYRLIKPNSTDFFGNEIYDVNGDRVDDVIICDKKGNPVIINGYKLVQASPYKKVWANEKASGKTPLSFNEWLEVKFHTTKDWSQINENDWDRGKIAWDLSKAEENARTAYAGYSSLGLGKPKLNTRLSARALWSKVFSTYIWEAVKLTFVDRNQQLSGLVKLVDYLKVSNAMYNITIEWTAADEINCQDWITWVNYKNSHPKEANKMMGVAVQKLYAQLDQEDRSNTAGQTTSQHTKLINAAVKMIVDGFNITKDGNTARQIAARVESGSAPVAEIKAYKDSFKANIDSDLTKVIPGFKQYLQSKPKKRENFDDYAYMTWDSE